MQKRPLNILLVCAVLSLALFACQAPANETRLPAASPGGPLRITGEMKYTNDFVTETYFVEHMVALVDLHGFVIRDQEWEVPVDGQVLGYMKLDAPENRATYQLDLPAQPRGVYSDVDNDAQQDRGVQIFAVSYWPNLAGGPYSEGDDRSLGWPDYLASVRVDSENQSEVTGGKLLVWAPDDQQQFPTAFGDDKLLFTKDDPIGPLPAGYSLVDLDRQPFALERQAEVSAALYEPDDVGIKDFSKLGYSEAFEKTFAILRKEYAFNGIPDKQPDWDALYAQLGPKVKAAEQNRDAMSYYLALLEFSQAFRDGHVSLGGGEQRNRYVGERIAGGYGFAVRELSDGRVIVIYLLKDGPAEKAGMQIGAEIGRFNQQPIAEAIGQVKPVTGSYSTSFGLRYDQARFLLRAPLGQNAEIEFTNPGGSAQTVTLSAVAERQSFSYTSLFRDYDPNALPVEFRFLPSGAGYVRVNSNYDDLNLVVRLFERALKTFAANDVPGVVIDMRLNTGGAPLGLAGFLTDKTIPLGQLEYYSEKSGQFEPDGPRQKFTPNVEQYRFNKLVLLVGQGCYSACEIESYGFSQVPGMIVVGEYPTAGVEAEVARGEFQLPDGMTLRVPTGRFTLPDGSIFLEGQGVTPMLPVPTSAENVLSGKDYVLQTAEELLSKP